MLFRSALADSPGHTLSFSSCDRAFFCRQSWSRSRPVGGHAYSLRSNYVYSTIDKDLQKTTYESLKQTLEKLQTAGYFKSKLGDVEMKKNEILNRPYINATSGATVVTDVRTGEILAWVNYPSFNLNLFSTGITNSDWESLKPANERDPLAPRPLLNIAMQTAIQPGSTFKLASTLAALEKGLSPEKKVNEERHPKAVDDNAHDEVTLRDDGPG